MKLSSQTVENLIREISSVIDYDVNIMDDKGIIISSTNKERIGHFHEAALLIINGGLPELQVHYDNEYKGCKEGTNLPLYLDDEIIGVLGITGHNEETIKYGNIIKRTSEILLHDYYNLERQTKIEQAKMFFINDWLNNEITDSSKIIRKLEKYKIHSSGTWQVVVVDNASGHDAIRTLFRERINSPYAVTTWNNFHGIIVGSFPTSKKMGEYIESLFGNDKEKEEFFFGISNTCQNEIDVPQSYNQAISVLQAAKGHKQAYGGMYSEIHYYQDDLFEIIIECVPEKQRKEFSEMIFSECNDKDIAEIIPFIRTYCLCNGSINAIANKLFIHKNTVQYKIIKIQKLTGLNLREMSEMEKLHLAARWKGL